MANPGTSGQRWKLSQYVSVKQEGDHLRIILSCGHSYTHADDPSFDSLAFYQERIASGKRTACKQCKPER